MASNTIFLTGKASWAKLAKPDEKYNVYAIDLALDKPSMEVFKASGLSLQVYDKPNGPTIRLRRPVSKLIKNELVEFGAPEVLEADGTTKFPIDTKLIGNGSDVSCRVVIYDTMKGKGHRLEKVRVDSLVEYVPSEGKEDDLPF